MGGEGGCRGGDAALFLDEDDIAVDEGAGAGGDGLGVLLPGALLPPPSWQRLDRVPVDAAADGGGGCCCPARTDDGESVSDDGVGSAERERGLK